MTEPMRIARFLAQCGVAARRKAEEIVAAGRVRVNGEVATDLGRRVDPARDVVDVDGQRLRLEQKHFTFIVNKPQGYLVSRGDPEGRRTVYDLLPPDLRDLGARLVYAGRLDYTSEGMLVMTTDGELANRLVHPSTHVEKEYIVHLDRGLTNVELRRLREGVPLDGEVTLPCDVREGRHPGEYVIVLVEGRNRQIRRMIESVGAKVAALKRVRIGALELGNLREGYWKELSAREIGDLSHTPRPGDGRALRG